MTPPGLYERQKHVTDLSLWTESVQVRTARSWVKSCG